MAWQYNRTELLRRLEDAQTVVKKHADDSEEARKRFPPGKKKHGRTRMHLSVFHARNSPLPHEGRLQVADMESHLRRLDKMENMLWFGTVPSYFRCGHPVGRDSLRFDAYDLKAGPNFYAVDWKDADHDDDITYSSMRKAREYDCLCCLPCSGYIRDLHLQYHAYRQLPLAGLLPCLIPALYHIIRSYLTS
jgi:hypothetical protein